MSDVLILTLSLLACVLGCLARPCRPADFGHVKAVRVPLEPFLERPSELNLEPAPASEPGFSDGLTVPA